MFWFLGLSIVLVLGVVGVVLSKNKITVGTTEAERIAADIDIIDVTHLYEK